MPSIVSYGRRIPKYQDENRSKLLCAFSFTFTCLFFIFVFVLNTFAANQLSDIPFEARQAASVSEMLRLISCHKPNDKTYFSDLLPLSTKFCCCCCLLGLVLLCLFIYGEARKKINFKFDYNKSKATHAHTHSARYRATCK